MKKLLLAYSMLIPAFHANAAVLPIFMDNPSHTQELASYPTETQVVSLANKLPVNFGNAISNRDQTIPVTLPKTVDGIGSVTLDVTLSCPAGGCDRTDTVGSIGVYSESLGTIPTYFELMRFITPYGIGEHWSLDVTDFLPLLKGQQNIRVFIDTWDKSGWLVDATLTYVPGQLKERTIAIVPLLSFDEIPYGDPQITTARTREALPLVGFSSAKILTSITGHGQGNAENCSEFCAKSHTMTINQKTFAQMVWRDDCATSVNPDQHGNYFYPRAGWCPGDKVKPWTQDITAALTGKVSDFQVTYDVEAMDNTCRPGVKECIGCTHDTGCEFDGGPHTQPRYLVSAYVIYKK